MDATNNTNFNYDINQYFINNDELKSDINSELKLYQRIPTDILIKNDNLRGIMIYVEMGFGKTRIAIDMAENLHKKHNKYKIVVLTVKTLHENFKKELDEYSKVFNINDKEKYKYITFNSYNMFSNMMEHNDPLYTKDDYIYEGIMIEDSHNLENTILIVDEFQLFCHAIANSSKNAVKLYFAIMNTKNVKIIGLTGTPIINNIFSIALGFNMLKGHMKDINSNNNKLTLFPENQEIFYKYFVKDMKMINKDKYANRITGLVYYYGLKIDLNIKLELAELKPIEIVKVMMSPAQSTSYNIFSNAEANEKKYNQQKTSIKQGKKDIKSSFKSKTRKVSNFLKNITQEEINNGSIKKEDLNEISPKFIEMMKIIDNHKDQIGILYSYFVHKYGINDIALCLKNFYGWHGFSSIKDEKMDYNRYAIISGDIDIEERLRIISVWNKPENKDGKLIKLILLSGAVALGVSLYRGRYCILFEPPWDDATTMQVIYRILRLYGHVDMEENEKNVQPYMLLSVIDNSTETTDVYLYNRAQKIQSLIDENLEVLRYSSFNCLLHYDIDLSDVNNLSEEKQKIVDGCNICKPTNTILYYPKIDDDLSSPLLSTSILPKKVNVEVLTINGDEYFIDKNKNIYIKDDNNDYKLIHDDNIVKYINGGNSNNAYNISDLRLDEDQKEGLKKNNYTIIFNKWNLKNNDVIRCKGIEYKVDLLIHSEQNLVKKMNKINRKNYELIRIKYH
jgi:hypothetical protein